ncbi:NAD(P)-binding protein [Hyaloscypha bicolor E]|uniref:NAD(P)-binding protein n=1 Tax=Hyaloscypha bicolor E TaxID=1095630 RepID=A0A2J6T2H9_9HELO|nr:NAD(P)-binding protein [Hyaloscypha bicolor E]PMD57227.1 NAD(P)-binding protein [Hyaloscypha bicolor E]
MPKTIAALGVAGTQGGSVASHFLSLGWNVRGISRSSTSSSAEALKAKGIDVVQADVDDPQTLIPAFRGAHVIFAVTDFWAPYFAAFEEKSKISDRETGEYAYAIEVHRRKNIVDAADVMLKEEGSKLERFVSSTLPGFKEQSKGKHTYAYHFDSKADITSYLKEKNELWEKSSLLNMGFYADNIIWYGGFMGAAKPCEPTAVHPFVIPGDTGLFVSLLVNSPPKQDLLGVSEIGREVAESTATSAEFGWGDKLILPWQTSGVASLSVANYFLGIC